MRQDGWGKRSNQSRDKKRGQRCLRFAFDRRKNRIAGERELNPKSLAQLFNQGPSSPPESSWQRRQNTAERVQMLPSHRAHRHSIVALTVLGTIGLAAVAMADPMEPSKIRTIRVTPQSADDLGDPSKAPAKSNRLHVLTVRPRLPDEQRDAAGHELSTIQQTSKPAADAHVVRTMPVRLEPQQPRNTFGREWSGTPGLINGASNAHHIRTLTIRSERTDICPGYNRFVPEAGEPTQSPPR